MRRIFITLSFMLSVLTLVACTQTPSSSSKIIISPGSATMYFGQSKIFEASVPSLKSSAIENDVTWKASCGEIARVFRDNVVQYKAPAKATTCQLTATSNNDENVLGTIAIVIKEIKNNCTNPPNIPGVNLQNAIKKQLEINRAISCEDLEGMKRLASSTFSTPDNKKIKSLEGLQFAVRLEELNISYSFLDDISAIKSLIYLRSVHFHKSKINNIEALKNLVNLQNLQISSSKLSNLEAIKSLTNLKDIRMFSNQITDLNPLKNLTNLETLWLAGNSISKFEILGNMPYLKNLTAKPIEASNIMSIIPKLSNLTHLYLNGGTLTNIDAISSLSKLEVISLSSNQISNISPLKNMSNLRYVNLKFNNISNISALVENPAITGDTSTVEVNNNCLDLSNGSQDIKDINSLKAREVKVKYEPQKNCN